MGKTKAFFDNDYGWDRLYASLDGIPGESKVVVGVLRSSAVYKPKKGRNKQPVSVAQIAAIHEFGSKDGKIPERSFMRSAMSSNQKAIENLMKKLIVKMTDGLPSKIALGVVGQFLRDKIVAKINSGIPPVNAQSTIERKGSSKTLIDTGQLKSSIDWEIKEGKKGK